MTDNAHVQTLDALRRRLNDLHDVQGMPWRTIARRAEFEGIPHGTLWSIANGREPVDVEHRRVLGLPPKTVEVEPCADCGKVHAQLHTCDEQRNRSKRTAANGWHRRAAWLDTEWAELYDEARRRTGMSTEQVLMEWTDNVIGDDDD